MKQLKRLTALLLCILMVFPTQGITAIAETVEQTGIIEQTEEKEPAETLPLETEETDSVEDDEVTIMETERIDELMELEPIEGEEEPERIQETLPLQPLYDDDYVIYWNPGSDLPVEIATASDATSSNASIGKDTASGRTPAAAVQTLEKAIERAEELMAEEGVIASDITIYAMNPMEIADSELYILNGGNINIAAWPGRTYASDAVFYINGGQLTIMNTIISGRDPAGDPDVTELIYVRGGTLQMGSSVVVNGRIVMDYHTDMEENDWEGIATVSDAAAKHRRVSTASFDINKYILDTDEDSLELLEDKLEESTWKEPIIELMEGFGGEAGEYLLEVRIEEDTRTRELVKTLYADEVSAEEFLDYFMLVDEDEEFILLQVETQAAAQIRDTGLPEGIALASYSFDTEVMTQKTLIASRAGNGTTIFWNPGGSVKAQGVTYPEGKISGVDGTTPYEPFKTWELAVNAANGGRVICMQPLTLGSGAEEYLGASYVSGDTFTLRSNSLENIVTLTSWQGYERASIIVPENMTLVLDTIIIEGLEDDTGNMNEVMTIHVQGGDVVIENNVTADTGYFQIDASSDLVNHPMIVNSVGLADDGNITLYFGGINNNLNYRFVDVVVPSDDLDSQYVDKDALGDEILGRLNLHGGNKLINATSKFSWMLRKDTILDGGVAEPQKIELYTQYYYDAIYINGEDGVGNDLNLGATCESPVKTWGRARELWLQEMALSIAARADAAADPNLNYSAAEIDKYFPLPKTIYICGTVTVDGIQEWNLDAEHLDYTGDPIKTEIHSHTEHSDGVDLLHELPEVLIHVVDGGELTFGKEIYIRNYTNLADSSTVLVEGSGKLTVKDNTVLTGEKLKADGKTVDKARTLGIHVQAKDGATVILDSDWIGSLENRGHGLWLDGATTTATMSTLTGAIQNNDAFDPVAHEAVEPQKRGSGVVMINGASFTMTGGKITNNSTYQYGAGVYMEEGSRFVLSGGEITGNKMKQNRTAGYPTNSTLPESYLVSYGIGIYAAQNTTLEIDGGKIDGQQAFVGEGVGIWTDGLLKINQSTVNNNYTNGTASQTLYNRGVGIYVGENGTLQMTATEVKGGRTSDAHNVNGNVRGVGIYLVSMNDNYITGSTISDNKSGRAHNINVADEYRQSAGGGIYLENGKLTLADNEINDNQAVYGGGIYVQQDSANEELLTISGGSISNNKGQGQSLNTNSGGGGGIFIAYAKIRVTDTTFEGNYSRGHGGAIYVWTDSVLEVSGSSSQLILFKNNTAYNSGGAIATVNMSAATVEYADLIGNKTTNDGHGGAIFTQNYSELTIDNSLITDNSARYEGGGVATWNHTDKTTITNTVFSGNKAGRSAGAIYARGITVLTNVEILDSVAVEQGGGAYFLDHVTIEETLVQGNQAGRNGGGLFYAGGNALTINGRMSIKDSQIIGNETTGSYNNSTDTGRGGGYATWAGNTVTMMENVLIQGNKAITGGGIANNGVNRLRHVEISGNEAVNGGGVAMWYSFIITESTIQNNTATGDGGGFYIYSNNLHLTDEIDSGSTPVVFSGNVAGGNGGGIYQSGGAFHIDLDGEIQNRAGVQGSNIFINSPGSYLYGGTFKQPYPETDAGIYNVYVNVSTNHNTQGLNLDPSSAKIEPKTGADTDAIYLFSGNSFLVYLNAPDVDTPDMPISLNKDAFEVGSIVVKPANRGSVNVYRPNAALTGDVYYTITYPTLKDAAINLSYNTGGSRPRRTSLAKYVDASNSSLFNIVLVGEGVYLDGEKGDDTRSGLTPEEAVLTFEGAKTRLRQYITDSDNQNGDGFIPFIYICGTVTIPAGENPWVLDYDDPLFVTDNAAYIAAEEGLNEEVYLAQVRRFASFIRYPGNDNHRPLIRVGTGSNNVDFEMGRIIIDGMAEAVITNEQSSRSALVEIMDGSKMTLTSWSQLRNNYYYGVIARGDLYLEGEAPIPGEPHEEIKNRQIFNIHGQYVRMTHTSTVNMSGYSRILTDGKTERMGTIDNIAIYSYNISGDLTVHMSDHSSIINLPLEEGEEGAKTQIRIRRGIDFDNSYAGKKEVHMTNFATIENFVYPVDNNSWGIRLHGGPESNILLTDDAQIINNNSYYGIFGSISYTSADLEAGKEPLKITLEDRAYVESLRDTAIGTSGGRAIITMSDQSELNSVRQGIYANSTWTFVTMSADANIKATQHGIFMKSGSVEMSENTYIDAYNGTRPTEGIWSNGASELSVTLKDNVKINARQRGIRSNSTVKTDIILQDQVHVDVSGGSGDHAGIYFNDTSASVITALMRDQAKITAVIRGIYVNGGSGTITMNDKDDPTDEGSAMIRVSGNGGHGITLANVTRGLKVIMNKNALIEGNTSGGEGSGVAFTSNNNNDGTVGNRLEMNDNSRITNHRYGIFLHKGSYPIDIVMADNAAVDLNYDGIGEKYNTGDRVTKLNVVMQDNARISGNWNWGIYLGGLDNFERDVTGYHKITLYDNARIGGDKPYTAGDALSGNGYSGIYTLSPLELILNDESNISWNGHSGTSYAYQQAVMFTRYGNSGTSVTDMNRYFRVGASALTMNENSYIANNKGSVYATHGVNVVSAGVTYRYPNTSVITLNGTNGIPMIRDNGAPIYAGDDMTIRLEGDSRLAMADSSKMINLYGYLELDGRSEIDGYVHMYDSERPITMIHPVTDTTRTFRLYLVEGFLGKIVVTPDKVGMTDVTSQLKNFVKEGADGLADEKKLMDEAPDIVLEGNNHVYLSGTGNDDNNGNSPATAVRTFKRAKELLETGYFRDGANIIITTSTVIVKNDDLEWSFGEGGKVTNTHPKGGQTWVPLVIRDPNFTGRMIEVNSTTGNQVVFKNITIDGGSAEGTVLSATVNCEVLAVAQSSKALIGEGAIFQNNHVLMATSNYATAGIKVVNGTLDIDGGIIRNMVKASTVNSSHMVSSAVMIQGENAGYTAVLNFKSGQIINNEVNAPLNTGGNSARFSTVALYGLYATINMSGGVIADNTVANHPTSGDGSRGGALLFLYAGGEISGGTIRNNTGGIGSAIYYEGNTNGGRLVMSGGQIIDNKTNTPKATAADGVNSPVNIRGYFFELKGGSSDIRDNIYLFDYRMPINLSGAIYQKERLYHVYLNTVNNNNVAFGKGHVVVQPDKVWLNSATSYINHFEVHTNAYILDRGQLSTRPVYSYNASVMENECLILMKAVFLDYDKGIDTGGYYDGSTPKRAVKTFGRARTVGASGSRGSANYYVIYLSGRAVNHTASENLWTLPSTAYMCRYTGFTVYDTDGTAETGAPYYEYLIEPQYNLTLDGIRIYGRRNIDSTVNLGNSIVRVNDGIQVTMKQSDDSNVTYIGRNYNLGEYNPPGGTIISLDSRGGGIRVHDNGILRIEGGTISDVDATYGSAIHLDAATANRGRMHITGKPAISGSVYLSGSGVTSAARIETDQNFVPGSPLLVAVGNDYNGRDVIEYTDEYAIGDTQYKYFAYEDSLKALYDIMIQGDKGNYIRLSQKVAYYLDGKTTNATRDGLTPESAFGSLRELYEAIDQAPVKANGYLVYVVDTVDITAADKISLSNIEVKIGTSSVYQGTYSDTAGADINITGQVYFKRYARPSGYTTVGEEAAKYSGFNRDTMMGTLFHIKANGELTFNGIYVDGHSVESVGNKVTVVADAVEAKGPLFTVDTDGTLYCGYLDETAITGGIRTNTKMFNNKNTNKKDKKIGELNGSPIDEGTGGGIELLGGKTVLEGTEFSNMEIGAQIAGGEDVYTNGDLHFSKQTLFSGTVYLEGFGTAEGNQGTSRYLTVDVYGTPVQIDFQVLMRDPYNRRTVIYHAPKGTGPGDETQIGRYRLEEKVKEYFMLNKREGAPYIYELQLPPTVYIGGPDATDDQEDTVAGSTPNRPVASLRRAFQLLKTRGGGSIYVVGTIEVDTNLYITGNTYEGDDEPNGIFLGSTNQVKIIRYIQPDYARDPATAAEAAANGYDVEDFTGVMMNVQSGCKAVFSNNVIFDGHSEEKMPDVSEHVVYPKEIEVSRKSTSLAPMITVAQGGILELLDNVTLQDNNNVFNSATETAGAEMNGGAIYNSGTASVDGTLFTNNHAVKASGVYQDGTFTIMSAPENLKDHTFYLTSGSTEDHVIRTEVAIPENQIFDIDMDRAVKGRDVVKFLDPSAYDPDVDSEHVHFRLGATVPPELFLVEAENDPTVLELQNWEILKVEVPTNIYLVVTRRGSLETTTRLKAVIDDPAVGTDLFTAPQYTINNKGNYDARVSITGFENKTTDAGIGADLMNLTVNAAAVSATNDLYLAIKGLDDTSSGTGFAFTETSLRPYAEATVTEPPLVLGTLKTKTAGNFTFIGAVGNGFVDKYMDAGFPIEGSDKETVQDYMDGNSGTINARAKYLMKYKVEIVPSRRNP